MNNGHVNTSFYDSAPGPSLQISPEELDQLDHGLSGLSQLADEMEAQQRVQVGFGNDMQGFQPQAPFTSHLHQPVSAPSSGGNNPFYPRSFINNTASAQQYNNAPFTSSPLVSIPKISNEQVHQNIITPPQSDFTKPTRSFLDVLKEERDKAIQEMQQLCEQRIHLVQKTEREKYAALENEYRTQLSKVQQDLDNMLHQQHNVLKLKNDVEMDIQQELTTVRADLSKERELRRAEREKYEQIVRDLRSKIGELERKLAELERSKGRRDGSPSSSITASSPRWGRGEREKLIGEYEDRIDRMQQANDQKVSKLIRQFEREKEATIQILKTRIQTELSLLVPKIQSQCQASYSKAIQRLKQDLSHDTQRKHQEAINRLKQEQAMELKIIQKQMREQHERERAELQKKLRSRFEVKLAEVKNDCERRLLERIKSSRRFDCHSDENSFLESENDSFVL